MFLAPYHAFSASYRSRWGVGLTPFRHSGRHVANIDPRLVRFVETMNDNEQYVSYSEYVHDKAK